MASSHIISSSKVRLPITDHELPNSTTQLSFFDVQFVEFPLIKAVLLYPNAIALPSSFDSFKSSLALTLAHFHPLVGDLTYLPSSNDVAIVISKDSGVIVLEAKSDLDIHSLIDDSTIDGESLSTLVPNHIVQEFPMSILSVQFTSFSKGGIGVGVASHHVAMDGWGLRQFMDCWSKTCRDGVVPPRLAPVHDRSIILHPYKEEMKKQMSKLYAPNLPKINANTSHPSQCPINQPTRRLFKIDTSSIQLLKQRVIQEATDSNSIWTPPITSFQALAALYWIAISHAKGLTSEDTTPTILIIPMDCRSILDPPIDIAYTGNCIRSIFVESNGASIMAPNGLSKTCECIAEAISVAKEQPLGGTNLNDPLMDIRSFAGLKVVLSGSPRMKVYDADFGWGKPDFHAVVSMNCDGVGIVTAGRGESTVQLQVALKGGMDEFVRVFHEGLNPII